MPQDPRQAREWRQRGEKRHERVVSGLWDWKLLITIAVHEDQIVGVDFLPSGQNMNAAEFRRFLEDVVKPYVRRKRIRRPIILIDNVRLHFVPEVMEFIEQENWEILPHPPYSPDLNPCEFDVFHRIKRPLKGRRFENPQELRRESERVIEQINQNHTLIGIANIDGRWQEIIDEEGNYL
jgi:histone-lysine N-methyltransferase SETMAR